MKYIYSLLLLIRLQFSMLGFKKIFGKLRRTNSGGLQQQSNNSEHGKEEIKDVENNRNEPDNSYEKPHYIQPKQHIHVG